MRIARTLVLGLLIFGLFLSTAGAQWINYPTPGVPRTPDGKPNLAASAPRSTDGHPDLSGLWDMEFNRPGAPPPPFNGCINVTSEFLNIGSSLKGGLPFQPWAAELVKTRRPEERLHDPVTNCLPGGIVRAHSDNLLRKVVQTPGLILILSETNSAYRQIFTDGRPLPDDPTPSWNGYSSGKWDGDTLVVRTIGFRDGLWLDSAGSPMTDSAKITERFHRTDFGHLEIELTVDDPKAYTRPWTVTLHQEIKLDTDLLEFICSENEKDVQHFVVK